MKNKTLTQIVKEQCWISRSSEGQCHSVTCWWKGLDLNNIVCEYEVNGWLMKKLLEENKTLTQIVNNARRPPAHPFWWIYKPKFYSKNPAKNWDTHATFCISLQQLYIQNAISFKTTIINNKHYNAICTPPLILTSLQASVICKIWYNIKHKYKR